MSAELENAHAWYRARLQECREQCERAGKVDQATRMLLRNEKNIAEDLVRDLKADLATTKQRLVDVEQDLAETKKTLEHTLQELEACRVKEADGYLA